MNKLSMAVHEIKEIHRYGGMKMNKLFLFTVVVCVVVIVLYIIYEKRRINKIMQHIEEMLDAAMDGRCTELTYDETRLSRLESRFMQYLIANELAVKKLTDEKDKINMLISDISHQTKTPIANLLLYSELLSEEQLPAEADESVVKIHAQAEKLSFLISSLVKLSRLETGIVKVNPSARALNELLIEIYEQYKPAADKKGLKLIVHESDEWAVFDAKWTLEAVGNIVDNAIKYTERGTVDVAVTAYESFICIKVSDSGIGIKESETAQVFGRFYCSQDANDEKGVGIGLFLARQIVQSQGGYIKLKSLEGQGSEFSIYLPALPPNLSKP
ncbi:MAG: HAMP domain-containing histidine kinase [Butyrivibrio sp.]|nr:HAMP domain-containing histidine kinase [Butyrivibrio sp.]